MGFVRNLCAEHSGTKQPRGPSRQRVWAGETVTRLPSRCGAGAKC